MLSRTALAVRLVAADKQTMPMLDDNSSALAAFAPEPAPPSFIYETFYGLREKAFSLSADPRFWFRSPAHGAAFDDLFTGIRRREGLIVLTGEIGTGKTTLCRSVIQQLDGRTFAAFVADPFASREDLLKTLLVDFGVLSMGDLTRGRFAQATRGDLSYLLYEFLDSLVPLQAFAVLVIDEAQHLSLALLEEIRILSELERREKLLQVVLVGQPELKASLKLPQMRQVDHRVSVRCELTPLDAAGVVDYVQHRLAVAGRGSARLEFTTDALHAIFTGSEGVPRLVNRICDRTLQHGHAAQVRRIEIHLVRQAIDDLGLAPASNDAPPVVLSAAPAQAPAPAEAAGVADTRPTPAEETAPAARVEIRPGTAGETAPAAATQMRPAAAAVTTRYAPRLSAAALRAPRPTRGATWIPAAVACAAIGAVGVGYGLYARAQTVAVGSVAVLPPSSPRVALPPAIVVPHGDASVAGNITAADVAGAAVAFVAVPAGAPSAVPPAAAAVPARAGGRGAAPGALSLAPGAGTAAPSASAGATAPAAPRAEDGMFSILVASFKSHDHADRVVAELAGAGFRAHAVERDWGPPRGRLVHVSVDGYASAIDVERDLQHIRELPGGFRDARIVDRQ